MLYRKTDSLLLRYNISQCLNVVCVQDIFVESTLRSNYLSSQVSFPIIHLGTDVHLPYLAAYEISNVFTKSAALALPPFHEFTGCDTVNTYGQLQK